MKNTTTRSFHITSNFIWVFNYSYINWFSRGPDPKSPASSGSFTELLNLLKLCFTINVLINFFQIHVRNLLKHKCMHMHIYFLPTLVINDRLSIIIKNTENAVLNLYEGLEQPVEVTARAEHFGKSRDQIRMESSFPADPGKTSPAGSQSSIVFDSKLPLSPSVRCTRTIRRICTT